jgi:hypothetical protein
MRTRAVGVRAVVVGLLAVACAFGSIGPAAAKRSGTSAVAKTTAGPKSPFYPGFFGMSAGAEITKLPDAAFDREMNLMGHIGVHWIRAVFPWSLVQPQDNGPDDEEWAYVDRLVNYADALGMQIDAIIDNAPAWAQIDPPTVSGCTKQPNFDVNAYASFAAEVAARYPTNVVSAIELENAPNLPGTWTTPDACDYTRLMQASYTAIKAVNPDVLVLTAGLGAQNANRNGVRSIAGDVFFSQMYDYGAHGYFDVLSWHPYSYPCTPSETCSKSRPWYKNSAVYQAMVDHGDGSKPIWATEFGAPTNGTADDGHVTEAQQNSIMVDGMNQWVALPYAGPMFVYSFRDSGSNAKKKDNWFGLVSRDFKHQKPAYFTYRQMALGLS